MREHLLGYLLGALDPEESQRVEQHIQRDGELRAQLASLRQCLAPLAADRGLVEPPTGLAVRTCRHVMQHAYALGQGSGGQGLGSANSPRWRFQDLVVAAGVFLAASMLFFPAVSHSRYNAQMAGCQFNLRQLGISLMNYGQAHADYFPSIPTEGHLAVSGIVGPTLVHNGYLDDPTQLICPARASLQTEEFRVPTLEELEQAGPKLLRRLQRRLSGDYGYNLGVKVDGRYQGVRNLHRSTFALMADAPCWKLGGKQSSNHGGCGQNVLFEDGHVEFQAQCRHSQVPDDYYRNDEGFVSAGMHLHDAVIGHSSSPPLILTRSN